MTEAGGLRGPGAYAGSNLLSCWLKGHDKYSWKQVGCSGSSLGDVLTQFDDSPKYANRLRGALESALRRLLALGTPLAAELCKSAATLCK